MFYFCKKSLRGLEKVSGYTYNVYDSLFSRWVTDKLLSCLKDVKRIGFLGFGKSNRAIYRRICDGDFEFTIRSETGVDNAPKGARLCFGDGCFAPPYDDVLFLSPSARRDKEGILKSAASGTRLSSDAELFFALCDAPLLAVSGSDGKSTTVRMAEAILTRSGLNALACGNVGLPFIEGLYGKYDCLVTEISSFTLEYMTPRVRRALITNITENHLDWHGSFAAYIKAKENLIEGAREVVLSPDTEACIPLIERHRPWGIFSLRHGYSELRRAYPFAECIFTSENGVLSINGDGIIEISRLSLKEPHNVMNALSAIALTHGLFNTGCGVEALCDFSGLRHRMETVSISDGVRYVDSSIDSTPGRTAATLLSMPSETHVILGGRGKGLSYAPLIAPLKLKSGCIIISGENREEILRTLSSDRSFDGRIITADTLAEAVRLAKCRARRGDTVLLSPASTSYDAFSDFEERGDKFKEYVKNTTEGLK